MMIYYVFRFGLPQQQNIGQLTLDLVNEAPSKITVERWFNEFDRGHDLLTHEFKNSCP